MSIDQDQNPSIDRSGSTDIVLRGSWRVESLAASVNLDQIRSTVWLLAEKDDMAWDLTQLSGLDYIGAQLLWDGWKRRRPANLLLTVEQERLFARLESGDSLKVPASGRAPWVPFARLRNFPHLAMEHVSYMVAMLGQLVIDLLHFIRAPHKGPWKEISARYLSCRSTGADDYCDSRFSDRGRPVVFVRTTTAYIRRGYISRQFVGHECGSGIGRFAGRHSRRGPLRVRR